ncbi:MAG: hypothetical protein LQ342_003455 [Letrouitia transgressa]|nr:MAG: hypothetical protein LQ342_003455 [Letrouitia transgressa]
MHKLQFPPLNPLRREIRILKPFARQDPKLSDDGINTAKDVAISPKIDLQFELKVVSIDDLPEYTALSYVWGAHEGTKPLSVNGQDFLITENLNSALRHVPYADISPAIWIDSVCIDQANDVEKTEQIRLMKSIYSSATFVIVWLGLPTEKSDFIIDVIESFADNILSRFNVPTPHKYQLLDYLDFDTDSDVLEFMELAVNSSTSNAKKGVALAEFIKDFLTFITTRAWWYRIWVLQEFVFARQVYFQVGNRRLDLEGLSALFYCILQLQTNSVFDHGLWHQRTLDLLGQQGGFDWILNMLASRERCHQSSDGKAVFKVFDLLCTIYLRPSWPDGELFLPRASDKRDQIYGLVGLFEEENLRDFGLIVDYRQSWQDIYCDVAQKLIAAGNLDVLSLCQARMHSILPSWTPIWHEIIEIPSGFFKSGRQGSVLGNSLFNSASTTKVNVSFSVFKSQTFPLQSMRITGISVDVIMDVKSVYARSRATSLRDRELLFGRLFRDIDYLCERSKKLELQTYTSEFLCEAAWRMPVWDYEPSMGEGGDEIRRATKITLDRYNACLPFFEAVEKHMTSEQTQDRDLFSHPIMKWQQDLTPEAHSYLVAMEVGRPMRPFMTSIGYIGFGPMALQSEDVVAIFFGARVPCILRRRENGKDGYIYVGEAYLYGLMDGEGMDLGREPTRFEVF